MENLDSRRCREYKEDSWWSWRAAKLMVQDMMNLPSREPIFPAQSGDSSNPSLSEVRAHQSGLLNKLTRSGMWRLRYAVLTDTSLHFFSSSGGEFFGNHDSQLRLCNVQEVEDGPALPGSLAKYGTLVLNMRRSSSQVVLCAYDKSSQQAWKASLRKVISALHERSPRSGAEEPDSGRYAEVGINVLCVSSVSSQMETATANPASCNMVVRMMPSWGDSMVCPLERGGHLRVWMSNGLVCFVQPEREPRWHDSRTLAPIENPGYELEYSLKGITVANTGAEDLKRDTLVTRQQVAYGVLLLLLNLVWWDLVSATHAYWASAVWMALALASGALPGPSVLVSQAVASGERCSVVRLHLVGCKLNDDQHSINSKALTQSMGRRFSTTLQIMELQQSSPAKSILQKVDAGKLTMMKKRYPGKSEVQLARFLIARKHDVDAAMDMVKVDETFRSKLEPITAQDLCPFMRTNLMHFLGFARDGTPLVFFRCKHLTKDVSTIGLQKLMLRLSDLTSALCPGEQCMTIIADFSVCKPPRFIPCCPPISFIPRTPEMVRGSAPNDTFPPLGPP
uniref:PH domain-containing protein n=1 Tax=Tetraselmis sp. GSL018 TaxID=582737 RepID=A0A061S8V2_9CHLO|eukprot:CAMPEP_0177599990 /NCGR_PEP_ID=MMETSP0419_2-20121207/13343_1 /TAXON_ID=582737 /ORGANISM="Tetraselmis sp., Strain GSL018" /LENGTH=564 /DNA_ID=CAMNT_0019092871 /DNA_START=96 /DNA_END=1790 /DNA_ORIENTATION=-